MPYLIDNPFYVTRTGDKYHEKGCIYLPKDIDKDAFPVSIDRAKLGGYKPCKFCILNIKNNIIAPT